MLFVGIQAASFLRADLEGFSIVDMASGIKEILSTSSLSHNHSHHGIDQVTYSLSREREWSAGEKESMEDWDFYHSWFHYSDGMHHICSAVESSLLVAMAIFEDAKIETLQKVLRKLLQELE